MASEAPFTVPVEHHCEGTRAPSTVPTPGLECTVHYIIKTGATLISEMTAMSGHKHHGYGNGYLCGAYLSEFPHCHDLSTRREGRREGGKGGGLQEGLEGCRCGQCRAEGRWECGWWATLGGAGWNVTHIRLSSSQGSILLERLRFTSFQASPMVWVSQANLVA